jgi:hypothetical protein
MKKVRWMLWVSFLSVGVTKETKQQNCGEAKFADQMISKDEIHKCHGDLASDLPIMYTVYLRF